MEEYGSIYFFIYTIHETHLYGKRDVKRNEIGKFSSPNGRSPTAFKGRVKRYHDS